MKANLQQLIHLLAEEPKTGTDLGHGIHKIRMAISSKGKGKSGGSRVISFLVKEDNEVYLVHIYDKSQLDHQ